MKSYLRLNENFSLRDSIPDSSEKLLHRRRGHSPYISDFGEGGVRAIKHVFFFLQVSASHKGQQ